MSSATPRTPVAAPVSADATTEPKPNTPVPLAPPFAWPTPTNAIAILLAFALFPVTSPANAISAADPPVVEPSTATIVVALGKSPVSESAPIRADVKVPTDVMFGCAAVYTVPATRAFATCPVIWLPGTDVMFAPSPDTYVNIPPVPDTLPAATLPVTSKSTSVPTEVIAG